MKRRDHTAPVSCLLAAVVFLLIQGAAVAQEFMPPPACYPGTPSLVVGRFYIQGGVTYRNIQTFGFERSTRPVIDPFQLGVPPFGPNVDGPFGTGTPTPGYPPTPTGTAGTDPNTSGIWVYDNGSINPNGDGGFVWPNNPFSVTPVLGLGQYLLSGGGVFQIGVFTISAPSNQVGTGATPGFDPAAPPVMANTFSVTWSRVMDATVNAEGGGPGLESILYRYNGQQLNEQFQEKIWTPSIELGFQWTNFFDMFTAFSWYDMSHSVSKHFTGGTSNLLRRQFTDTFPFSSDNSANWPTGPFTSNTVVVNEANQQINPDSPGVIGFPRRVFSLVDFGPGTGVPADETVNLAADLRVYEWRNGVRSWVPLYGMGRFGVTFGPMMSILNWNASEHGIFSFTRLVDQVPVTDIFETLDSNRGTLISWGLFAGADVEVAMNRWFAKFSGQYNLSEQKALANSPYTDTNINLSGFNGTIAGGLRF
jgi:hypothetical protein